MRDIRVKPPLRFSLAREGIKPVQSRLIRIGWLVLAETGRGAEQQGQQEIGTGSASYKKVHLSERIN